MKWINILGLSLQFISFWLAAPELLGESSLKRLREGLLRFVSLFPLYFFAILGVITGLSFAVFGILTGLNVSENHAIVDLKIYYAIIGISLTLYFFLLALRKKIEIWLRNSIATPLIDAIINDNVFRKRILFAGALFFTLGFLLQLAALLFS